MLRRGDRRIVSQCQSLTIPAINFVCIPSKLALTQKGVVLGGKIAYGASIDP